MTKLQNLFSSNKTTQYRQEVTTNIIVTLIKILLDSFDQQKLILVINCKTIKNLKLFLYIELMRVNCFSHLSFLLLFQNQAYKGVERDPYSGDVAKVANAMKKELGLSPIDGESSNKPSNRVHQGVRDLHESSFTLSGDSEQTLDTCFFGNVYVVTLLRLIFYIFFPLRGSS